MINYGCRSGQDSSVDVFMPPYFNKGIVARAVLYFYIMYEPSDALISKTGDIPMLLEWNNQNPPDAYEIERNSRVAKFQGSSNPYIEYPELANIAWKTDNSGEPNWNKFPTIFPPEQINPDEQPPVDEDINKAKQKESEKQNNTSQDNNKSEENNIDKEGLNMLIIVGSSVGGVVIIGIVCFTVWYIVYKKLNNKNENINEKENSQSDDSYNNNETEFYIGN